MQSSLSIFPCLFKASSHGVSWRYSLGDLSTTISLHHGNIVLTLQIDPKLRTVSKISAGSDRRIGGDRATTIQNVGKGIHRWIA